ncbi:hypothetical protein [Amycolatopsis sp. cmx-4-68]|uniref:hypothetical protein n=1 Tax=Amycolatopsis sp. cmx-4-68 TaxID=2790938 RepID=UPI003978C6FF
MSSTANARRGTPARPAFSPGEVRPRGAAGPHQTNPQVTAGATPYSHARGRAPRPWAVALQRPAAKILVAGGLTLAGWLLTGALSGSTASAAERPACPDAPAVSTVDHAAKPFTHGKHRRSHRGTAATSCARQETGTPVAEPKSDETAADETRAAEDPTPPESTKDIQATEDTTATTEAPAVEKATTTKATSSGGLLGGLVGVVGGTLNTVTNTVGATLTTVTGTVGVVTDTLSHTVLAPLTQPSSSHPDSPVLLPLDDLLGPVLSGGSNSGGVTATVPGVVTDAAAPVLTTTTTAAAPETTPVVAATPATVTARVAYVHLAEQQNTLPAVQQPDQPRDSGVHARNGGGGGDAPGLPGGGTSAPSAPASSASAGHDGPGGARHPFAVHTDDVTTTQLKLIGASRDHEVDGAGREAALPTTSPD